MWLYEGEPFTPDMIQDYYGFVYLITNKLTGMSYVGRKYFYSKAGKNYKKSNWEKYKSSCKELLDDIKKLGEENFKFEILSLHEMRGMVNYSEVKTQFLMDVLYAKMENGDRQYYNKNIMSRFFILSGKSSESTKKKLRGSINENVTSSKKPRVAKTKKRTIRKLD
jgi:hypothetical protein